MNMESSENENLWLNKLKRIDEEMKMQGAKNPDIVHAVRFAQLQKILNEAISLLESNPEVSENYQEDGAAKLTKRETEILQHIACGLNTRQISQKLFLSHRTVETHKQNLMKKLHRNNTAALVGYYYEVLGLGIVKN